VGACAQTDKHHIVVKAEGEDEAMAEQIEWLAMTNIGVSFVSEQFALAGRGNSQSCTGEMRYNRA
jgi:hypothetical protein